jgi:hypothetical protein
MATKTAGGEGVLAVRFAAVAANVGAGEQYRVGLLVTPWSVEAAGSVVLGRRMESAV